MECDLYWPRLISGRLIRRYQRFKADILLDDGNVVTAHCPNSGSLKGCLLEGGRVYISDSNNPRRKFPYTWEIIELRQSLVMINTFLTNRIVKTAICRGKIKELSGYRDISAEFCYEKGSRIDLLLKGNGRPCLLEVKSCTLVEGGIALFPDAPTKRGKKHLDVLSKALKEGYRSVIFYLIQRMDSKGFHPACAIDPDYCDKLCRAMEVGVEFLAYDIMVNLKGVSVRGKVKLMRDQRAIA